MNKLYTKLKDERKHIHKRVTCTHKNTENNPDNLKKLHLYAWNAQSSTEQRVEKKKTLSYETLVSYFWNNLFVFFAFGFLPRIVIVVTRSLLMLRWHCHAIEWTFCVHFVWSMCRFQLCVCECSFTGEKKRKRKWKAKWINGQIMVMYNGRVSSWNGNQCVAAKRKMKNVW